MKSSPNKYDFIIAGAGLSGLSLAYKIRQIQELNNSSILLIDKDEKRENDRTWSFWTHQKDTFESIITKKWPRILFANDTYEKEFVIEPYNYNMIRGIDFYNHVIPFLKSCPNTDFFYESINIINANNNVVTVETQGQQFTADYLFKSYYENLDFSKSNFVWQHFKGWTIETEEDTFDPELATFMDFRVDQKEDTRFFYVLPQDSRTALVEFTIFSSDISESSYYDSYLKSYINEHVTRNNYKILEEEVNAIPMTDYNFNKGIKEQRIINIGTNGGSVKGSSGYAYKYIQKETDRIAEYIQHNKLQTYKPLKNRFKFYDSIFLNAILTGKTNGEKVFGNLFKKLSPQLIFKFLDEESSFGEDLKIFTAPPTLPFTKAFIEQLF